MPHTSTTVAVTGGVACGKSTVGKILQGMGYPLMDSDHIARTLLDQDSSIRKQVLTRLGTLDRKELREIIFHDPKKKKELESILHPSIQKTYLTWIDEQRTHHSPYIFVLIPLLFESGSDRHFDKVLCVVCDEETQLNRLRQRDGIDDELAMQMVQSQLPNLEKAKRSDWVIENNNDLSTLETKLNLIFNIA
ncbi:MAG: dephospho-CoA kinase [Bdellovibrionota bacterium]